MKNYTPALVNTQKTKTTIKSFFLGNAIGAKASYYCARHKTEDIYILWIESSRFGGNYCFPCVLEEQGDPMVYITGMGMHQKAKNRALVQRWGLFVTPGNFSSEFDYGELTPENFHAEYSKYKDAALCRELEAGSEISKAANQQLEAKKSLATAKDSTDQGLEPAEDEADSDMVEQIGDEDNTDKA